jgi:hypothetical protein
MAEKFDASSAEQTQITQAVGMAAGAIAVELDRMLAILPEGVDLEEVMGDLIGLLMDYHPKLMGPVHEGLVSRRALRELGVDTSGREGLARLVISDRPPCLPPAAPDSPAGLLGRWRVCRDPSLEHFEQAACGSGIRAVPPELLFQSVRTEVHFKAQVAIEIVGYRIIEAVNEGAHLSDRAKRSVNGYRLLVGESRTPVRVEIEHRLIECFQVVHLVGHSSLVPQGACRVDKPDSIFADFLLT